MNDIIDFLTSKEIIVVYIIIAVALFLCLVIYIIDKTYYKRKRRQNTRKLNKLVEDVNLKLEEENQSVPVNETKVVEEPQIIQTQMQNKVVENISVSPIADSFVTPSSDVNQNMDVPVMIQDNVINNQNIDTLQAEANIAVNEAMQPQVVHSHDKIDELMYTDAEPDKEEATRELIRLTEELEKAEKAQRDGIDIAAYENAQEENAIISLDELSERSEEMYAANELTQYADEGNEPISLEDLEKRKAEAINIEKTVEPVKINQQENISHAYQGNITHNNDVFSSVFGSINNKNSYQTEEELEKTSEFLLSLKDLQSRLNS